MTVLHERVLVSAPGKVILFGEHSVVYQKTAIASSLGLRSYLVVEPRQDDMVHLILPDIQVDRTWKLSDLPFHHSPNTDGHPSEMPRSLQMRLQELIQIKGDTAQSQALLAFLYLLIILHKQSTPLTCGFTLCVRSFVPVGAGLGSSASYSVVLATSLLILYGLIPIHFNDTHLSTINEYAFKAEQVIHGNPSGVDNAIATYGGAKSFIRGESFETLKGFHALKLLLTNTKVPRSTSLLVAGVGEKKKAYPEIMDPLLDAMDKIAVRCKKAFETGSNRLSDELDDLVVLNHCLLDAIGVGHPSLEKIRAITAQSGLKTKLTGAGGGGCAVTLLREDVPQSTVNHVMGLLKKEGFDCYETSVGGKGVTAIPLIHDVSWLLKADRKTLESLLCR
ncbi:ribosomal protein S5 domain 2-type protein [Pilobolus umbonatus]|nr:ribosomal protein S5 domain 2-type protein [Pilobolus umbonatus]